MSDRSQTWHYGLVARFWAEHNTEGAEIEYFRRKIQRNGQPALDAGCGTGRLLIPYLRAGMDVDGCDASADMLSLCAAAAKRHDLSPQLYECPLHVLDLPRRYRTIVVCGVFGIGVTRAQDQQGLQVLFRHLEPGGLLVIDNHLQYCDPEEWGVWQKEQREAMPRPWSAGIGSEPPQDGSDYELHSRILAFDPLKQCVTRQMRTLLWQDGKVVSENEYTLLENVYFTPEMEEMLQRAGFRVEGMEGNYEERDARSDDKVIVFLARKSE